MAVTPPALAGGRGWWPPGRPRPRMLALVWLAAALGVSVVIWTVDQAFYGRFHFVTGEFPAWDAFSVLQFPTVLVALCGQRCRMVVGTALADPGGRRRGRTGSRRRRRDGVGPPRGRPSRPGRGGCPQHRSAVFLPGRAHADVRGPQLAHAGGGVAGPCDGPPHGKIGGHGLRPGEGGDMAAAQRRRELSRRRGVSAPFPRFDCPTCGRSVASLYRDAIFGSVPDASGRRFQYAYLRSHRSPSGEPCPTDTTGPLATTLGGRRRRRSD